MSQQTQQTQQGANMSKPSALIFTNSPHLYFSTPQFELEAAGWEVHLAPASDYYPESPAHYVSDLFFNVNGYSLVLVEDGYLDSVLGSLFEACLSKVAISGRIKYNGHNWYLLRETVPGIDFAAIIAAIANTVGTTEIEQ